MTFFEIHTKILDTGKIKIDRAQPVILRCFFNVADQKFYITIILKREMTKSTFLYFSIIFCLLSSVFAKFVYFYLICSLFQMIEHRILLSLFTLFVYIFQVSSSEDTSTSEAAATMLALGLFTLFSTFVCLHNFSCLDYTFPVHLIF